ncbi:hypothetical protein FOZ61_000724 [Perkinsus olseni]|uniref:PPM-type phosphatase domain-containing protein n=1 Tax=Perkinsus olseni TaxID=32597 RepID=A0A7J6KSG3_PEROL|nr:hypothetical protein FOZ61_000724 [Perkinsus olseni]
MFSYHETQNAPHRRTMEDAHIFHPSAAPPVGPRTALVAVLDGHGGSRTALDIVLDQLPAIIGDEMRGHPPGVSGSRRKSIKAAMIGAFARMDQELRPCAWQNGLTATVLLIKRQKDKKSNKDCCTVICANVGDSRAILVAPSGRLTRLTQDHRPTSNAAETDRVVNNGGVVLFGRVGGQLAVSRALGDWCLKNDGVISEPSVSVKREVVQGSIVVAASDGVWDVLGDEEVATFVSMHINEEDVAEKLVCLGRLSRARDISYRLRAVSTCPETHCFSGFFGLWGSRVSETLRSPSLATAMASSDTMQHLSSPLFIITQPRYWPVWEALKHHILAWSIAAWSRACSHYGRDIGSLAKGGRMPSTNRAHHSFTRDMVFPPQGDSSFDLHAGLYDVSRSSEDEELLRQLPSPSSRIGINTTTAIPIQNDNFIGELVVIHRPADERFSEFPYSKFMSDNVYFGIEGYSPTPKLGFMAKITARILMSISTRLAAAHESRLISNFPNTSQQGERTYFLFPLTSADTVIEHSSGGGSGDCEAVDLPDITSDRGIYGKVSSNHKFDTGHIYTFCYWSMFVDFVTWDLRNLPAISGTSLCTLLGPQPIHIVMRDDKGTCFMNILSAHK